VPARRSGTVVEIGEVVGMKEKTDNDTEDRKNGRQKHATDLVKAVPLAAPNSTRVQIGCTTTAIKYFLSKSTIPLQPHDKIKQNYTHTSLSKNLTEHLKCTQGRAKESKPNKVHTCQHEVNSERSSKLWKKDVGCPII
jgi:hypothetical protein